MELKLLEKQLGYSLSQKVISQLESQILLPVELSLMSDLYSPLESLLDFQVVSLLITQLKNNL